MKIILIFIIFFIGFSLLSFAENINECKTDIYYGNGVWNEPEDAEDNRLQLEIRIIKKEIIEDDSALQKKYGEVKLAYNWGQGTLLDVLETYYQLRESGQLSGIGFFTAMAALTIEMPGVILSASVMQALMEQFTKDWEQGNVDEMWDQYYHESFKLGHRVLLVSHSQGNLFANRIYDTINPTAYKRYFANVQVASPASEVKADEVGKGSYITLWGDPIINPIPGSMSGNANGSPGHAFIAAYLDQQDPYEKIVSRIKSVLPTLDVELTQWDTDQEFEPNTCESKVTVKHRFDLVVDMPFKVYPFNLSKKLYQVDGEWVKASCGGKNILGQWEEKKENECWMINNTEKEKIEKHALRKLYIFANCRVQTIVSSFSSGNNRSQSGMICNSGVVDNTNKYSNIYLEKDDFNTMHLDPVVPQGTDYLTEAKSVFLPLYVEATKYVNNKFNEYKGKYPIDDAIFFKRGFDIEYRDPDDGHYYHIGAGCFAEPSLVLDNTHN